MKKDIVDSFREYQQKGVGPLMAYVSKRVKKMKEAHINNKYKELEMMLYNLKRESDKLQLTLAEKDAYIKELESRGV
jgi:hypothetical protein